MPRLLVDAAVAPAELVPAPRAPLRPASAPLAALLGAAAGGAVLALADVSAWGALSAAAAALLVWLAAIDLETRLIPNRIVLPATAVLLAGAFAVDASQGLEHAAAATVVGGGLLVAATLRPGALGMGDVKLGLLLGALLGSDVLEALTIGFLLVAAVGLVAVVRDGRTALKRHLPLAPFLAAGAILTLLAG